MQRDCIEKVNITIRDELEAMNNNIKTHICSRLLS
jgi:hypothetical protein